MTMTVRQMREWMETFEDQDAIVQVVVHSSDGGSYYCQGGSATEDYFNPAEHVEYTDFRGNQFVSEDSAHYNRSYVTFGVYNG